MDPLKRFFADDYNMAFLWLMLSLVGGAIATAW